MAVSGEKRVTTAAAARLIARDPSAFTGALLVAVIAVLVQKSGGVATTTWYPAALFTVVLAVVATVTRARARVPSREVLWAAGALGAYVLWCFASVAWSGAKDASWDGSNLALFYLALFLCTAVLPWRRVTVATLLACFSLIVAAEGFIALSRAVSAEDLTQYFDYGRLAAPLGYQNAACAAFLMAFWPMLLAASRREVPTLFRGVALAVACTLPELALLSQSRASLVATPATFVVYLVLVPRRARTIVTAAIPLVVLLAARGRLLEVYPAVLDGKDAHEHLRAARDVIALSAGVGFVAGLVVAVLDLQVRAPTARRVSARAVLVLSGLLVVVAVTAGLVRLHHPEARVQHAWRTFRATHVDSSTPTSSYFSTGIAGNRYDIWRVAFDEFKRAPLLGVGVDNFANDYLRYRRSQEEPEFPHSIELRVLAQTGIVGALLVIGFMVAVIRILLRLKHIGETRRAIAGAALSVTAYWIIHGSIDWFWEIPALGGVAFLCLGWAVSLARTDSDVPSSSRGRRVVLGTAAALAVIAVLSMLPPWLSAQETATAVDGWPEHPARTYSGLAAAARLNPLSSEPDLVAGAIAARLRNWTRMRRSFSEALMRQPVDWYAHLELAIEATQVRNWGEARRQIAAARTLDPLEPTIAYVADRVRARSVVSVPDVDRIFVERIRQ
jgi:hypothetical protein